MNPHILIWAQFFTCVVLIGLAGVRLIRYGDAIATLTGLSRSWIGLILIATVTSLPELVTGLSSVAIASSPDIAIGDVLGSCVFNLAILGLMDIFYRKDPVYAIANQQHVISAGFGVMLLVVAALVLPSQDNFPNIGHVSWGSLLILMLYVLAMRTMYLAEQRHQVLAQPTHHAMTLKSALTGYVFAAIVIIGIGIWLPLIGVELASLMGWSNTMVGTLFIAFATSVPELATTWGAARIGAIDMAFGNLLGSNLFDILILAIDDFAYHPGSLYAHVSPMHVLSAMIACLMSGVVVLGLAQRPVSRVLRTGSWAGLALLALYLLNTSLQFMNGQ